jgi:hypothetical protein
MFGELIKWKVEIIRHVLEINLNIIDLNIIILNFKKITAESLASGCMEEDSDMT